MGYHTHFYAYDAKKQNEWANQILEVYRKQLCKELSSIPNDDFFKKQYQIGLDMTTDEKYQEFKETSTKYRWPQDIIDGNEEFFAKYRDPNYTWKDEKNEWVQHLKDVENTGLLTILDFKSKFLLSDFLIKKHDVLKRLDIGAGEALPKYQIREGKIYSGEVFKRFYRVKGRYCQSMWFNSNGVIEMINDYDYPDLMESDIKEIENFTHDYPDWYCWII